MIIIHSEDERMEEETVLTPAHAAANWIVEQLDAGKPKKDAVAEAVQSLTSATDAAELFGLLSQSQ